jgi:DNA replication initiation complex subunit (GINS family)
MWKKIRGRNEGRCIKQFFIISALGSTVVNYYEGTFKMRYHMKLSIDEIENLTPAEKDIYIALFNKEKEEEKRKEDAEERRQKQNAPATPKMPNISSIASMAKGMR